MARLELLGHGFFYGILRIFGQRGGYFFLYPVILVYVVCSRKIHRRTGAYLSRRFPGQGALGRWFWTLKLVLSFGRVLVDRAWLGLKNGSVLDGELLGRDRLNGLIAEGKGLILLTAHVGNWQTALAHISGFEVPVNSLMHYDQGAVAKHYFDLRNEPVPFRIIRSNGFLGGMVEATAALGRGEVVTIMGDRYLGGPSVEIDFLGGAMRFPAAPYHLAAVTGAPLAVVLAEKTGRRSFRLKVWEIMRPEPGRRRDRQGDLGVWARRFSGVLEGYVRDCPEQWYNFGDFWQQ